MAAPSAVAARSVSVSSSTTAAADGADGAADIMFWVSGLDVWPPDNHSRQILTETQITG